MITEPEQPPVPMGEVPEWSLYEEKMLDGEPDGVKAPSGEYYCFDQGEDLSWIKLDGAERLGLITRTDGSRILLENWMKEKDREKLAEDTREQIKR